MIAANGHNYVYPSEPPLTFMALPLLDDDDDEYFTPDFVHLSFYSLADFVELGRWAYPQSP
ncbi:MAG: hypothetical protein WED11_09305 [Natronospirillum sp.]